MKQYLVVLFITMCIGWTSCQSVDKPQKQVILLTNTSSADVVHKPISIARDSIGNIPEGKWYPLLTSEENNDTIPAQLDDMDGDDKWDVLFFTVSLPAGKQQSYTLQWVNARPEFVPETNVRFGKRISGNTPVEPATADTLYARQLPLSLGYQRYQTDGPSWENDKVGFRIYLDGRNAIDLFGKKGASMTPENVGLDASGAVENNYQTMQPWGQDILSVGNSLGLGGISLMEGDRLMRLGVTAADSINNVERTTFRILSEGPQRSVIRFQYHNWKPEDHNYQVKETMSIWPGIYAFHNSVTLSGMKGDEKLLIGLVNIDTEKPVKKRVKDGWVILFIHDKQTVGKKWWLGLALILPEQSYLDYIQAPDTGRLSNTYLARLQVENGVPVSYFSVACWELRDPRFKDPEYFKQYLLNLVQNINAKVTVHIKE